MYNMVKAYFPNEPVYDKTGKNLLQHGSKAWIHWIQIAKERERQAQIDRKKHAELAECIYHGTSDRTYLQRRDFLTYKMSFYSELFHRFMFIQGTKSNFILPTYEFTPAGYQREILMNNNPLASTGFTYDDSFTAATRYNFDTLSQERLYIRECFNDFFHNDHNYFLMDVHHRPLKRQLDEHVTEPTQHFKRQKTIKDTQDFNHFPRPRSTLKDHNAINTPPVVDHRFRNSELYKLFIDRLIDLVF